MEEEYTHIACIEHSTQHFLKHTKESGVGLHSTEIHNSIPTAAHQSHLYGLLSL